MCICILLFIYSHKPTKLLGFHEAFLMVCKSETIIKIILINEITINKYKPYNIK